LNWWKSANKFKMFQRFEMFNEQHFEPIELVTF